jgi:hypothetical protein
MNELATRGENGAGRGIVTRATPSGANLTVEDVWTLAESAASSKLFPGINTPQAAFTLMMICQSEGLHPMQALKRYHIIEGRPSMRADAIQAEFQADGGKIKILRCDAEEARAVFSHPVHQPDGFEFHVTMKQFAQTYGGKAVWKNNPSDMLWWRLVTKAVKKIHPGIVVGIPSSEEVMDGIDAEARVEPFRATVLGVTHAAGPPAECDVIGYAGSGPDGRPLAEIVTQAAEEYARRMELAAGGEESLYVPLTTAEILGHLVNKGVQAGHCQRPASSKSRDVYATLHPLYKAHRDFVRAEIMALVGERFARQEEAIEAAREAFELSAGGGEEAEAEAPAPVGREPGED